MQTNKDLTKEMIEVSATSGMPARRHWDWFLLLGLMILTIAAYWPGLSGSFLFDDYPNIIDNKAVQPLDASWSSLINAALSSPSSSLKRPLASLSFAANFFATGLNPYWMKLTNLCLHLLNGLLVYKLAKLLLLANRRLTPQYPVADGDKLLGTHEQSLSFIEPLYGLTAAVIAGAWMLLPINLTGVLYVVQRMESMANVFVLLGLIGYVSSRCRMTGMLYEHASRQTIAARRGNYSDWRSFAACLLSITIPTALGITAKETAVMLPVYALAVEWIFFRFRRRAVSIKQKSLDTRIALMFVIVLLLPFVVGMMWLIPSLMDPRTWATRDFTLNTRLLSELRIVADYIRWSLLPTPEALSFYHDDFSISSGWLQPATTLASAFFVAALVGLIIWSRKRYALVALGLTLFLSCQLLTATILPLELIYEHRNYFASFGLLLVIVPPLTGSARKPFALPRYTLLTCLFIWWAALTTMTSYAWGNPLKLAQELAARAPESPRAEYELGRTYIIYSRYDPASVFTTLAYAPLEKAASLPESSILPEQALIFMNAKLHIPSKDAWWKSLIKKLGARQPGVQDESSLSALTACSRDAGCNLPTGYMTQAFIAALSHPSPSARLLATYGDYAWNVLNDRPLGERMTRQAIGTSPGESAYHITLIRMLIAENKIAESRKALAALGKLNTGGRLDEQLKSFQAQVAEHVQR